MLAVIFPPPRGPCLAIRGRAFFSVRVWPRGQEAGSRLLQMAEPGPSLIAPHSGWHRDSTATSPRHRDDSELQVEGSSKAEGRKPTRSRMLQTRLFCQYQPPPLRCARVVGLRLKVQRGRAPASGGRLDDHSPHPRRVLQAGSRADSPPRMAEDGAGVLKLPAGADRDAGLWTKRAA